MFGLLRGSRSTLALGACIFLFAAGSASRLNAQTGSGSGTITGTVADVTGKAIPNSAVTVRNEATGATRQATADTEGKVSVGNLAEGTYLVEASAPSFTTSRRSGVKVTAGSSQNLTISLNVGELAQSITVEGSVSVAAETAPSQSTLEARSAKSEISPEYVQNYASPIADFSELLNNAPGTFSVNPNGVGLGDSKTFFRGFKDGQYTMQADGIPFNDTNDPTHHSWAFFPSQFIAGVDFDRSPGSAASIGPTNFGGTINLLSRSVAYSPDIRATAMYGSFNTRMLALDLDSGQFGGQDKKSSLTINIHQMLADGYQTYNYQKRVAGFLKYQYRLNDRTTFTVFSGLVDLWTNTPNLKGPSRAQIAQFGDDYLLSGNPADPNYYGYNFYHVQTDFEYIGVHSDLGHGWILDNKLYTYRYWNKQNYNNPSLAANGLFPTTGGITATSAVDKLNGYRKVGDITSVSHEWRRGILRTGLWFEWAYTDRYQVPSDPRTWVDTPLPNFHEHFITTSAQPFIEYEYRVTHDLSVTAGIKVAQYGMNLTQYADNGKTVGNLNGAASTYHDAQYRAWMPSLDARYKLKPNWTAYAQFGTGSNIPPSSVFDSKGAQVAVLPKPTSVKTYQLGSVVKFNRWTLDFDAYYSHFQNPYSSYLDTAGESFFYQTGPSNTKGVEAEGNVLIGHGLSLYLNGTMGSAKYQGGAKYANGGLWIANAPKDTEAVGLTYAARGWNAGIFNKRVGRMFNDNGSVNQAVAIDPFNVTNLFFNYTIRGDSTLRGTKIRFGINNLFDQHNIVGIAPAAKNSAPNPGDILTLLPARSFTIQMTFGYAPKL
jgi:iron complex outermembrane receptor protein